MARRRNDTTKVFTALSVSVDGSFTGRDPGAPVGVWVTAPEWHPEGSMPWDEWW